MIDADTLEIQHGSPDRLRQVARDTLNRLDDVDVRKARRLAQRMRSNPPRVIYLGESLATYVSYRDPDPRTLGQFIADAAGVSNGLYTFADGGYPPELHAAAIELIAGLETKPVVLLSLASRFSLLPWKRHPFYFRSRAVDKLTKLNAKAASTWRIRMLPRKARPSQWNVWRNLRYPTLLGERSIGDYVDELKGNRATDSDNYVRTLYAYHHTGLIDDCPESVPAVRQLGETLAAFGAPVLGFELPICLDTGFKHFGSEFVARVDHNLDAVVNAINAGYQSPMTILRTRGRFTPDQFVDPNDGTEHLNSSGRAALASLIGEQLSSMLEVQRNDG